VGKSHSRRSGIMMLSDENLLKHKKLRSVVSMTRTGHLWPDMTWREKVSYFALELTRMGIGYGIGGRYNMEGEDDDPATWSRFEKQGDSPPKLECAGFVEMVLYGLKQIEEDIFNYRGLRFVPWDTEFYKRAALGDHNYEPNWIPGRRRPATITELNEMGAWAQTPVLLFFREEFEPAAGRPQPGDVLSFMSHDHQGYHFHSAIWIETANERGIVHSSPNSGWDPADGPKYTPAVSNYYRDFLRPQQHNFERMFGAAVTRLKENA